MRIINIQVQVQVQCISNHSIAWFSIWSDHTHRKDMHICPLTPNAHRHKHCRSRVTEQYCNIDNTMTIQYCRLPAPARGVCACVWTAPQVFHICAAVFGTPVHTCFSAHVTISNPGHSRPGHKVTSSDLPQKKFECFLYLAECPITLKLSVIDIRNIIYKMRISEFWYRWS